MRDPVGNEKRYQECFDRRIRLAQALAKDAAAMPVDVRVNIAASNYSDIQKIVVWQYAAGMPLPQLTALAQDSVAELGDSTAFLREQLGAADVPPDFAMQRKMFEQAAKNGATPEDRADAASVLKNWDAYVAEARGAASEGADQPRRVEQRNATGVFRYTRIADTCAAPARK